MLGQLRKKLQHAAGRSEFVISVICDIRGFSSFSTCHESPDTAMFIKRFYLKLLEDYFISAAFAKPTGDGLLLIFRYTEDDLHSVSEYVLSKCFKVIDDFPTMFKDDPMINFTTPARVGFGISRGPSCCLFSGKTILDYSGQLLNLAARLNDLARPRGVVIAGSYLLDVIPATLRERFKEGQVYVRGIAEEAAIDVFYSKEDVELPAHCLQPITVHNWELVEKEMTVAELRKLQGKFIVHLPLEPISKDKTQFEIKYDHPSMPGYFTSRTLGDYAVASDASGHHLSFGLATPKGIVEEVGLTATKKVTFRFQFVPKPKAKVKKRIRRKKV